MAPAKGLPVATCQLWGLITWAEAGSGTFFLGPHPQMLTSSRWAVCYPLALKTSPEPTGPGRCVGMGDTQTAPQSSKTLAGRNVPWDLSGRPQAALWPVLGTSPRQLQPACWGTVCYHQPWGGWGWSSTASFSCLRVWVWKATLKKLDKAHVILQL